MRWTARMIGGALLIAGMAVSVAPTAGAQPGQPQLHGQLTWTGPRLRPVVPTPSSVKFLSPPYLAKSRQQLAAESAAGATVQTWTRSIVAGQDGKTYPFTMVGQDVTSSNTTTTIQAYLIPVIVDFTATGDIYDPTVANSSCGSPESPLDGELGSPEFKTRPWYAGRTFVGDAQYTDAQMREEFWDWTNPHGSSPGWHMKLNLTTLPSYTVNVNNFPEVNAGTCATLGEIDNTTWDNFLKSTVIPAYAADGVGPTTLPIFLVENVVLTNPASGGGTTCCIFGYHSSYDNPSFGTNTQTYAWTDYQINGDRPGIGQDVSGTSHEIAEWANDPYGNNPVPSWGHTGQDPTSCQNNLEVGDPLTQNRFTVQPSTPGGMAYHLQELTFMGWFFDQSLGVNDWYSTRGTFTSGATLCS